MARPKGRTRYARQCVYPWITVGGRLADRLDLAQQALMIELDRVAVRMWPGRCVGGELPLAHVAQVRRPR